MKIRPWVIFLDVPWDSPARRNRQHFLVEALSRRLGREGAILAVERPLTPGKLLSEGPKKCLAAWLGGWNAGQKVAGNLTVISVPGPAHELILDRFPRIAARYRSFLGKRISRFLPNEGGSPVVMIQHPYQESSMDLLGAAVRIYDRHDDYSAGPKMLPGQREGIIRRERRVLAKADLATVVTARMEEEIRPRCRRVLLLSNALDDELMRRARAEETPLCAEIMRRKRPVAGFIGKMTPRIDYPLLDELAAGTPEFTFLLVGPLEGAGKAERRWMARLRQRDNVVYAGSRPYAELAPYFKSIDVGLIPYCSDGFNLASNPLKIYEYLGAGKPVAATGIIPPPGLPGVHVYQGAAEVRDGLRSLAGSSIPGEDLAGVPRWDNQADKLLAAVESIGGERGE